MSWSFQLQEIRDLHQPDSYQNRILCALDVLKAVFRSEISGDEGNLFMESVLEICPVTMICVYRRWRNYAPKFESSPEKIFSLVTNRPWDYGHNINIKLPARPLMLAI